MSARVRGVTSDAPASARSGPSAVNQAAREVATFAHGKVPRDVRVRHMLALAEELFVERGFTGASMDELARRAGVSKPMVYDLVGTKEQVFDACIRRLGEELALAVAAGVSSASTWQDQMQAGGLAFFRFVADHRAAWTVLLAGSAQPFDGEVGEMRRQQRRLVAALIAGAPVDRSIEGDTPVNIGPVELDALAHTVSGAFESLAGWWGEHPEVRPEQLAEWLAALLTPGLRAMARDRPTLASPEGAGPP